MKNTPFYLLLLFVSLNAYSQAKKRTLPRTINAPNYDIYYPAVSGDGNSMIFMSNFTNSGDPSMNYAAKEDVVTWKEPYEMPGSFNKNHLLFEGGYSLNFDGTIAFISMQRSGGLGGYDIWYSKLNGASWGAPINYGNKLNTGAHESMPSISSSGQSLYFCKCETMNTKEATGCEVYVATKRGASWENSKKLPSNVNSFQPQSPKILADGETLLFSSKQGGSADLYLTRKNEDGSWTDPKPMNFVNTTGDEQFVSVDAKGRYLYHDVKTEKGREIEELLIPDEFKGKEVMHIKGSIVNANTKEGMPAILKVYETATRERIVFEDLKANETFNFAIKEGSVYDFSVEPNDNSYAYFSKLYDLNKMRTSSRDELKIELAPFQSGQEITLGGLSFVTSSSDIDDNNSTYELRRLTRLLKSNNANNYELKIHRYNYVEDSLASSSDLTEVIIDTLATEIEKTIQIMDTINFEIADSLQIASDSTAISMENPTFEQQIIIRDSVIMVPIYEYNYTYHNDRTLKQANSLITYLMENAINTSNFSIVTTRTADKPPREVPEIVVTLKMR